MLLNELKNIPSDIPQLRQFAWVMTVAGILIAGFGLFKDASWWYYPAILAGFFLLSGLLAPKILLPLQKIWMGFAAIMGYLISHLLLSLLYIVVFTGIRVIGIFTKTKFLDLHPDPEKQSYWVTKNPLSNPRKQMEKQF